MVQNYSKYIKNKVYRKTMSNWLFMIMLLFMFLLAMDFKTRMYYIAILAFFVSLLFQYSGYSFHPVVIPMVVLSISLAVFSPNMGTDIYSILRILVYPMCVLIGYNIVNADSKEMIEKRAIMIIVSLAAGAYVHFLLNLLININTNSTRNALDYWTFSKLSATGHSSMACMMIGVAISGIFTKTKFYIKCLCIGVIISIMYFNLILSGRTTFILIAGIMGLNFLFFMFTHRDQGEKIKLCFISSVFICIMIIAVHNNLFGIMDTIESSNFYIRFFRNNSVEGIAEDNRLLFKTMYIQHMLQYPFGGNELRNAIGGAYAHDVLLDTYSIAGIFAAGAVLAMILISIKRSTSLLFHHIFHRDLAVLISNVLISVFFVFSLEPILEGMPWLFMSFCIICGTMARLSKQ